MRPYDAVLLVSFGGPEGPDDVMPFLENVTAGRGVPRERLVDVAQHYYAVGGVSPINGQNRALLAAVRDEFDEHGLALPVYWGKSALGADAARGAVADARRRHHQCDRVPDLCVRELFQLPSVPRCHRAGARRSR